MCILRRSLGLLIAMLGVTAPVLAQPTYKLEVKPNLKPLVSLKLEGTKLTYSAMKDDPGFRLQYRFTKDGKPLRTVEGRSNPMLEIPDKTPGTYTAVVELFYPGYKTGDAQKGEFRPISDEVTYQVKAAAKQGDPVQVVHVSSKPSRAARVLAKPALVIHCGKEGGSKEKELVAPGYGYKLIQGKPHDGWKPPAIKSHCWLDRTKVSFEVTVPAGVEGTLRLHMIDGEGTNVMIRSQSLAVEGRPIGNYFVFTGTGVLEQIDITAADTKDGKIEAVIVNAAPQLTAVISSIEFFPAEGKKGS